MEYYFCPNCNKCRYKICNDNIIYCALDSSEICEPDIEGCANFMHISVIIEDTEDTGE